MTRLASSALAALAALAASLVLAGGCASVSGLSGYSSRNCGDHCSDEDDASTGGVDARADVFASDGTDGTDGNAGDDADALAALDAPLCDAVSCPASEDGATDSPTSGTWHCAKGGCNAAGGACTVAGSCFCTSDSACKSGACVVAVGRNDVSCGSACTGTGAADGFQCALGGPGIPSACTVTTFGYMPANLTANQLAALSPVPAVSLTCAGTVTFDGTRWTGATCSQTLPAPHTITQASGPSIDVLAFQGLAVGAGVTVNLTGSNAVLVAVFGNASIAGAMHADGAAGSPNSSNAGASGPGGGSGCSASAGGVGGAGHTSGGGGGGTVTAGGAGAAGVGGTGGAAGAGLASVGASPLRGGCPGGASGSWACTTSGGGGGGALQISVAGSLTIAGTVTANGGAGGTSNCASGGCAPGPNGTYGGGGGGGGAGGVVLLEGIAVGTTGSLTVNGGSGGNPDSTLQELGSGGAGATSSAQTGTTGTGSVSNGCGADNESGGGGGGGYGFASVGAGKAAGTYACVTPLSPAPACNAAHSACLCVDDSDCSSGQCVDVSAQCTGSCTGTGSADGSGCATAAAIE